MGDDSASKRPQRESTTSAPPTDGVDNPAYQKEKGEGEGEGEGQQREPEIFPYGRPFSAINSKTDPPFPPSPGHPYTHSGVTENHLIFDTHTHEHTRAHTRAHTTIGQSHRASKRAQLYYNPKSPPPPSSLDTPRDSRKTQTLGRQFITPVFLRMGGKSSPRRSMHGTLFRRHGHDRKENCFTFFDIETEKVESYQYRPGEEISGSIHLIVRSNVEIRYVELVVTGQGQVTVQRSRDGLPRTVRETYLYKQTYVIGSGDQAWTSVLTPGHYTSKFRVKLPSGLPSSLHHEDTSNGLTVDINYSLKARVCDDVTVGSHHGLVKVVMAKKVSFNVQRSFDLATIPDATRPVTHTEHVHLSCAHAQAAIVSVNLDRAVFLAGDDVRLQLTAVLPVGQRVKTIACSLQEHVTLDPKHEPLTFTLTRMIRQEPRQNGHRSTSGTSEQRTYEVTLPSQTDLVSSYSLGVSDLRISYSLLVELKFSPAGGKLSFKVPLEIGPAAEPIYAEKISSRKAVPLFSRTTRFPCFSSHPPPSTNGTPRPVSQRSLSSAHPVTTSYTNGFFARCFLCCLSANVDD